MYNNQEVYYKGKLYRKRNKNTMLIITIFLGLFGVHRFMRGHIGLGIIYLLTYGCFFIGWIIDIFTSSKATDEWNYMIDEMIKEKEMYEAKREGKIDVYNNLADRTRVSSHIDL